MLPKKNRLNKGEIEKILKKGRSTDSSFFRFKGFLNQGILKVSPVVSKKVSKIAVKRNNIKRKVFSLIKELNLSEKGVQGALFIKKDISETPIDDLKTDIQKLFKDIS